MLLAINDPAVQSALINAFAAVTSTVLAAASAALIGKKFSDRKKLEQSLELCQKDVEFLLQVEAEHVELHKERGDKSNKLKVRERVRDLGFSFSGKFTPGQGSPLHSGKSFRSTLAGQPLNWEAWSLRLCASSSKVLKLWGSRLPMVEFET